MNNKELPNVEVEDLTDLPSHQMAVMTMNSALADYFAQLDNIGAANQEYLEKEGNHAVHMTVLLVSGLMSHMSNAFLRMHENDMEQAHKDLMEFLTNAPRLALEMRNEMEGADRGHA